MKASRPVAKVICSLLLAFNVQADPLRIITFGDSTTAPRAGVVVYSELLAENLLKHSLKAEVVNKGIPGNTTAMAAERFQCDVLEEKPNMVVIQFGINDSMIDVWKAPPATAGRVAIADYEKNLRNFVTEIRRSGAIPILMTPNQLRWTDELRKLYGQPPYDLSEEKGLTTSLAEYAVVVRKIAHEMGVPLVDVYALYDEWDNTQEAGAASLLADGMHPNSQGHAVVEQALTPVVAAALREKQLPPRK